MWIQNAIARTIIKTHKQDHFRLILKNLHQLPVKQRIALNIAWVNKAAFEHGLNVEIYGPSLQFKRRLHAGNNPGSKYTQRVQPIITLSANEILKQVLLAND